MELNKFKKNEKQKKVIIGALVGLILLVGGITIYRTFALYEEKKEFNVLRGKVPDFRNINGSGDIQLAFTIEGEKSDGSFPNKKDTYVAKSVGCDGGVKADWDNVNWSLKLSDSNNQKQVKCTIDFTTSYSTVTYIVDGISYEEAVAKGTTVLNPKSVPIEKDGLMVMGWSEAENGSLLAEKEMGDNPITLYGKYVDKVTFAYTGGIQQFRVPYDGLYLLTVYGAKGGNSKFGVGGAGGTSNYYVYLTSKDLLYIVCGGAGITSCNSTSYNGGGKASCGDSVDTTPGGSGGGATHIATESGVLSSVSKEKLLVVAGGGGGGGWYEDASGGAGGGITGGYGGRGNASGGTSSTGAAYGNGGTPTQNWAGGGGGGLYGGFGGFQSGGAGGGSGYIPSVSTVYNGKTYTNSTTQGGNSGNGSASIQFITS